ncbi:MAG TPA: hypothetical protein DD670_15235 [Planctomycetaceae bacterium]|nr:hypothetical protein [Planctomycetaceae bacterium]
MRVSLLTLTIVLAMSSLALGAVTLDYAENPSPGPGYRSYNVQATGIGINTLGKFVITGDIHQVWTAPNTQSEWINNANTPGDPMDSYVLFGETRIGSLTLETIHNGGTIGLGTLNNINTSGEADAYFVLGMPSDVLDTYDLLKLVIPEGTSVTVGLDMYTVEYNPQSGWYDLVTEHSFFGNQALTVTAVPEPGFLALFCLGAMGLLCKRNCGR